MGAEAPERQVPAFEEHAFAPRASDHAVAVFVIDEGRKLLDQLVRMRESCRDVDVVVADGGSRDGSTEHAGLVERGVNTLLVKTGPGRLSAQMRMAFAWALDRGYRGVITIDGNGKDDPSAIPAFVAALESGVDHVQGSRFVPGGRAVRTPWSRLLAVRLIHAPLVSLAAGTRYTDTTNGFRAYSRRFLLDPRVAPFRDCFSDYELHYYLAIRAARLGFRTVELPVTRSYPVSGPLPTKISPLRGNLRVLGNLLGACAGRYDPVRT